MAATPLNSAEARANKDRLLHLAQTDGYLTVAMAMRLLDRSQMTAYNYLHAMVKDGLVRKHPSKQRWYLVDEQGAIPGMVVSEADDPWPMRRPNGPAPKRQDGLPSWRDDALVTAICAPTRSRQAA